jgi:putative transposase
MPGRPQLSLDLRPRTRAGRVARTRGRKPTGHRDPRHRTRPAVRPRHPLHVVLRTTADVGNLRRRHVYRAIRGAVGHTAARSDYRVVHVRLARGMQGFAISAARRLNRALRRQRGRVFAFRYHATAITTPTQARNAISYILDNWRHHGVDHHGPIDPFSSAHAFAAGDARRARSHRSIR